MSIQYRILGPIEVVGGGRHLEPGPPKQRALLAVLLVNTNRVVSRDRLVDDLWGVRPPAAATGSLQAYVANLRRVLEPGRPPRTPSRVLLTRAPGYLLRVDPEDLDATRFERLAVQGQQLLAAHRLEAAERRLAEALGLWRGQPLAEVGGYEFAWPEAARLSELALSVRELHAEAVLGTGRTEEAIAQLERVRAEAPLRERAGELLGLAMYRRGRQADALVLLDELRRSLRDELGVDPGPGLRRLHAAILDHDPALNGPARPSGTDPANGWASPRPVTAGPVGPPRPGAFVGREGPLATLCAALDDAVAGRGGVVVVEGEPGIGKTRLVDELAAAAADRDVTVARGRCAESTAAPPWWPWRQLLGSLHTETAELAELAEDAPGHLSHLVPDPPDRSDGLGAPPPHDGFLVCHRAADLVATVATHRPLLLICEDLHWADDPTLELLTVLAGRAHLAPVLLVATFRDTEVGPELTATLASLAREPRCTRVRLTGLAPDDIGRLAQGYGLDLDTVVAASLHARAAGNPYFAVELGRLLADGTHPDPALPRGLRDVLRRRMQRLPEPVQSLLRVAAIIEPELEVGLLERASGLDGDELLDAVETAVAAGLLDELPDPGHYRFRHPVVREWVQSELSGIRRCRLRARIAQALHQPDQDDARRGGHLHRLARLRPDPADDLGRRLARSTVAG